MSRSNTQICGVCQTTFASSSCVHFTGQGTADDPYVPDITVDPVEDNLIECGPNGLGAFLPPIYLDPPAVHCYATIDQVIDFDAVQALEFNKNRYDTDGMHSTDVGTDRGIITFKTPGIYLVTFNARWKKTNDNLSTGDMAAFLLKNGSEYLAIDSFPIPGGDSFAKHSISVVHPFEAGDFISALVKHDWLDKNDKKKMGWITTERMSPVFTATYLRAIKGMTIVGIKTD